MKLEIITVIQFTNLNSSRKMWHSNQYVLVYELFVWLEFQKKCHISFDAIACSWISQTVRQAVGCKIYGKYCYMNRPARYWKNVAMATETDWASVSLTGTGDGYITRYIITYRTNHGLLKQIKNLKIFKSSHTKISLFLSLVCCPSLNVRRTM